MLKEIPTNVSTLALWWWIQADERTTEDNYVQKLEGVDAAPLPGGVAYGRGVGVLHPSQL